MTTNQKIMLNMGLTVRNCVNQNEAVAKAIPRFLEQYGIMIKAFTEIQSIGEQQGTNKTGVAMDKNKLKKKLIELAARNSRKLAALAKFMNNDTLFKEVNYNETKLTRLAEVSLIEKSQTIYDRVQTHLEKLADQGVTVETQKDFQETIVALNNALRAPRAEIAERRKATERLTVLFQTADKALELMDYAVEGVRDEQRDFYNAYKTARKLVDTNSGSVALKAMAFDLANHAPIPGVIFTIKHMNEKISSNGNGAITKKTASKGSFHIRNLAAGEYNVAVKKNGYREKELILTIEDGVRNELKIELEKA
jgi:hypothetical protein